MSLYFQDGTRAKIKKVAEVKDNYSIVHLSTSRKKSDVEKKFDAKKLESLTNEKLAFLYKGDYAYSEWGFVRFVGKAHEALRGMDTNDIIAIKGFEKKEPYEDKEGNIVNPQNPERIVYDCELFRPNGNASTKKQAPVEIPNEDEIPF